MTKMPKIKRKLFGPIDFKKKLASMEVHEAEQAIQGTYDKVMEEDNDWSGSDPLEKAANEIKKESGIGRRMKEFNLIKKPATKTPEQEADEAWERTKGLLMENPLA